MHKLHVQPLLLSHSGHVHQARTVRTRNESRTSLHVSLNLIYAHLLADGCLLYREHTAESAALIRTLGLQYLYALN